LTTRTEVRRLTVVLGGGETDAQALTMLNSVLDELASEVTGLFLEDADFSRIAELPWSQEISRLTSRAHPLRITELQRQVRVQAVRAERAVQLSAERVGLKWSFHRMRGRLSVALQASQDVELLLLSEARRMLGAAAETRALSRSSGLVRHETARPIVAVFDGSERAERALRTAVRLANSTHRQLVILLPGGDTEDALRERRARATVLVGEAQAGFVRVPIAGIDALVKALRARSAALCVIAADEALLEESTLARLREFATCPLLIVR
jgi:hypothetical protein